MPGNTLGVRHGAYATLKLAPRAEQIAVGLRDAVPVRSPADDAAIDAAAMLLAQVERAHLVLSTRQGRELDAAVNGDTLGADERDDLRRLAQDARGWSNAALRYLDALGMTPRSRAALGLDIALGQRATLSLVELHRQAALEDDAA
jgi:hypothetical protein